MAKSSHRLGFIDQLRGWAVIVMIEVHTFNEWLHPSLKAQGFWNFMTFVNGLVAPSFIMLAGFSMGLAAVRKWDDYTHLRMPLWKRTRHLLLIFVVGYLLHLPAKSYRMWKFWPMPEKVMQFWAVDVLQLIVVSLLILHVVILMTRSRRFLFWFALCAGIFVFLFTPWAWNTSLFEPLPLWMKDYFNRAHGSLFPLFPWSGFVFWGAALSLLYSEWQTENRGEEYLRYMAYFGIALIAAAFITDLVPISLQPHYDYWRTSPQFSFLRMGIVLLLLYGLWFLETRYSINPKAAVLMGQESFLIYAAHLVLLYSKAPENSLVTLWKGQFNYLQCFLMYLATLAPMFALGYGWRWLKQRYPRTSKLVMYSLALFFIFVFLFFENGKFVFWILNPNDPYK
jgi:uncharacterized membrane protein